MSVIKEQDKQYAGKCHIQQNFAETNFPLISPLHTSLLSGFERFGALKAVYFRVWPTSFMFAGCCSRTNRRTGSRRNGERRTKIPSFRSWLACWRDAGRTLPLECVEISKSHCLLIDIVRTLGFMCVTLKWSLYCLRREFGVDTNLVAFNLAEQNVFWRVRIFALLVGQLGRMANPLFNRSCMRHSAYCAFYVSG